MIRSNAAIGGSQVTTSDLIHSTSTPRWAVIDRALSNPTAEKSTPVASHPLSASHMSLRPWPHGVAAPATRDVECAARHQVATLLDEESIRIGLPDELVGRVPRVPHRAVHLSSLRSSRPRGSRSEQHARTGPCGHVVRLAYTPRGIYTIAMRAPSSAMDHAAAAAGQDPAGARVEPDPGLLGRLGSWCVARRRWVFAAWMVVVAIFAVVAPHVENALSGAGWQADGSQSVEVRALAQEYFGGQASSAIEVVIAANRPVSDPSVTAVIASAEKLLGADPRISTRSE